MARSSQSKIAEGLISAKSGLWLFCLLFKLTQIFNNTRTALGFASVTDTSTVKK